MKKNEWQTPAPNSGEHGILSQRKTKEEIVKEQKEKKLKEKALAKELVKAKKDANKLGGDERTAVIVVMVGVLVLIVLFIAITLIVQSSSTNNAIDPDRGYFFLEEVQPELSPEGVQGEIQEMYFTLSGRLCVNLVFSNGSPVDQHLTQFSITIYNDDGKVIADGFTNDIPDDYIVPAGGYNTFTLMMHEDTIQLPDDPLDAITQDIVTKFYPGVVLPNPTSQGTTAATTGTTAE